MPEREYKIRTSLDIKDLLRKVPQAEKIVASMTKKIQATAGKDLVGAFRKSGEAAIKAGITAKEYAQKFGDIPQVGTQAVKAQDKYNKMMQIKMALERSGAITSKEASKRINEFAEATKKSTVWARDFAEKSGMGQERRISSLSMVMRNAIRRVVIWSAAMGGLWKALQAFKELITITRDIEVQMVILHRVMNEVTTDFDYMREAAFDLARTYGVSVRDVLDAMVTFARQGLKQKEVLDMTEASILAANVSTLGLTEAAEDLTAAVRQFNINFSDSTEIVNKWNNVANKNAVTMAVLADATKQAGIAGYNAGFTFDEFSGIVTALSAATRKAGSAIGRALRMIFQRMRRPSAIEQLQTLGIQVMETSTSYRRGADVLADVAAMWSQLTNVQKLNLTMAMAGTRRYNDLLVVFQNWDEVMKATRDSLLGFGSAEAENIKVMRTFQKQVEQLRASWQKLAEGIGRAGILQILSKLVTTLNSVLKFFGDLSMVFKQGILVIGGVVAGLTVLNVVLKMIGFQGKLGATLWAKFTGILQKSKSTLATTTVLTQQTATATRNLAMADQQAAVGRTKFISAYQRSVQALRAATLAEAQAAARKPLVYGTMGRPVPSAIERNVPAQRAWFAGRTYLEQVAPTTRTIATVKRAFLLAGTTAAQGFRTGLSKIVSASRAVLLGLPRKLKGTFTKIGGMLKGYGAFIGIMMADMIVETITGRVEGRKKEIALRIGKIVSMAMMGALFGGWKGAVAMGAIPAITWLIDYIRNLKDVNKAIGEQIKKHKEALYNIREQIETVEALREQWESFKKSTDRAAMSMEELNKMAHALAALKPEAFRGWKEGKALFRLPSGKTLALEVENLNEIMEKLAKTTTYTSAAEQELNIIFDFQASHLKNLQKELLELQKQTYELVIAQDKLIKPTRTRWLDFWDKIQEQLEKARKFAPYTMPGLGETAPFAPLVTILQKLFPSYEKVLKEYEDRHAEHQKKIAEINNKIKQVQGEMSTSYKEVIDTLKTMSAILGRYRPFETLRTFVLAQIIRPGIWERIKEDLVPRISDVIKATLATVPGADRINIEKLVKKIIPPGMTIEELRKIWPQIINEIEKQIKAIPEALTAVTTEWLKTFDLLTNSLNKFSQEFTKITDVIKAQKEYWDITPEAERGILYYQEMIKLTRQLREQAMRMVGLQLYPPDIKKPQVLEHLVREYGAMLDELAQERGVGSIRKTIDGIIKSAKRLEEVDLAPIIAGMVTTADIKKLADVYTTLVTISRINRDIASKKREMATIQDQINKSQEVSEDQVSILTGAQEDLRTLLEYRAKLLNKLNDLKLDEIKYTSEVKKLDQDLFNLNKGIVKVIIQQGLSLETIKNTLRSNQISLSDYYKTIESILGLDKKREKAVEEWKKRYDVTETLSEEIKSAIQLLDIYKRAGYAVDELSKRLADAATSQRRLREEAEYYLKPARQQAMISWLSGYMKAAPAEVVKSLGAQPRIAELIKSYSPLLRLFEARVAPRPPETARDVFEDILSFIKATKDKPLLTDDQAIKQGTTIGEVAGKIMAGTLAAATLKVKLENGINDYRFRSNVGMGATYYQFTIGDIHVEGNVDPEEIRQKVKEGVKDGTIEAVTETRGIIRREFDQNQLINVGE